MFQTLNLTLNRTISLHGEFLMSKDVKSTCNMYHMLFRNPCDCKVQKRSVNSLLGDRRKKNEIISDGGSCASNVSYSHPFHVIICVDLIFPDTLIWKRAYYKTRLWHHRLAPEKAYV